LSASRWGNSQKLAVAIADCEARCEEDPDRHAHVRDLFRAAREPLGDPRAWRATEYR
jgi:hypothetical protein